MLRIAIEKKVQYNQQLLEICSHMFPDAASTAAREFEAVGLNNTLLVVLGLFCLSGTKRCKDGKTL